MTLFMFGQHSAESAVCCLGLRYVRSSSGFIIGLGGTRCQFHGSSYLLRALSTVLEDGGEKFKFLCEGILVTESFSSVYQGSEK